MARAMLPMTIGLILLTGCRSKPDNQVADDPDELTLFSIDGTETWTGPTSGGPLYGCPNLGSVKISDPVHRRDIIAALKEAIRNAPEHPKGCWMPRHVLRVVKAGDTIDVAVCFECHSYRLYRDGKDAGGGMISPAGQPRLDQLLTEAGIPLAPKLKVTASQP
jgi:hypothetical protein